MYNQTKSHLDVRKEQFEGEINESLQEKAKVS